MNGLDSEAPLRALRRWVIDGDRGLSGALAPRDVAIRRGLMPLTGVDPFGDAYFALREEPEARKIPIYRPLNA